MEIWWDDWYLPTDAQLPIHTEPYRVKLVAGGERGGKSFTAAAFALPRIPDSKLIWLVAKDYRQSRAEFEYLLDRLNALGLVARYSLPASEYQPTVLFTVTGCEIRSLTAADEKKLGMTAPDGVIACEAAQLSYSLYRRLRARTAEKRGWLLLEGTFENSMDWYADLWDAWRGGTDTGEKSYSLPSWTNIHIFPGGRRDPEMAALETLLGTEKFLERHGGIPALPATAVFPEYSPNRHVGHYPFDPRLPVELAIDPGYAGAYSVLAIQWDSVNVYVVDEVYCQRVPVRQVIRECRARPWWSFLNPLKGGVIDIAGKQHQGHESQIEVWAEPVSKGGGGLALRARYIPIEAGAERLRSFLRNPNDIDAAPRLYYNESTKNSQREYKLYRYPEDQSGRPQREKPIDRDNHSIKALTYWLVDRFGFAERARRSRIRQVTFGKGQGPGSPTDTAWRPSYPGTRGDWRERNRRDQAPHRDRPPLRRRRAGARTTVPFRAG
jgi:hypothetical protein